MHACAASSQIQAESVSSRFVSVPRTAVEAAGNVARTNFNAYEALSEQEISGLSRTAHRTAATMLYIPSCKPIPKWLKPSIICSVKMF